MKKLRNAKKYVAMLLLVLMALGLVLYDPGKKMESVEAFRGANLEESIWNLLIADSVNEKEIVLSVDGKKYSSLENGIFLNDKLCLMLPISILREAFSCSVHLYEEETLLIEKRSDELIFYLDENQVSFNGEYFSVTTGMICEDGEYYVSAEVLTEFLEFEYQWSIEDNHATVLNLAAGESILPSRYDLREKNRVSLVKDQGGYGTCWAFAALSAIESVLLPEELLELSADHMTLKNSFTISQQDGGNYTMGMAYLTAWQGPVYEEDDPYGDNVSPDGLSAVKHVQEIQILEYKDYQSIKEAVFLYGGVQTSIYSAIRSSRVNSQYYNQANAAYCYNGTEKANHDIVIIGWDDSYSKENFNIEVEGDGAFICMSSWGTEFGEDGFFYVSYYDVNIGTHNLVYTKIEDPDNYDHIYQSDLCGWLGQLGYGKDSIYAANVYTAEGNENLMAAGFYAVGSDTQYKLYVVKNFTSTKSLSDRFLVAEGKLSNAGFYTIEFDEEVLLTAGETYAVVLYLETPGTEKPLAIEFAADSYTQNVDITDGTAYISANGVKWESLEETQNSNLCLKAYTKDRK